MSPTRVVSTFHPASAVVDSCTCYLADEETKHLVVARPDSIHVYSIRDSGLVLESTTRIWGRILSLRPVLLSPTSRQSNVLVLLDHPSPELLFLSWLTHDETASLKTVQTISLVENGLFVPEFLCDIRVDSTGQIGVVHVYQGKVKILDLQDGLCKQETDALLPELIVFSLEIIQNTVEGIPFGLAVLHLNHKKAVQLVVHDLHVQDVAQEHSIMFTPSLISSSTIPYPHDEIPKLVFASQFSLDDSPGALLVFGGRKILAYGLNSNDAQRRRSRKISKARKGKRASRTSVDLDEPKDKYKNPVASVEWPFHAVRAVCAVTQNKWLISDTFGRTCLLALEEGFTMIVLGETSSAESLTYLTNQVFFVGSSSGDSKLVRIKADALVEGSCSVSIPDDIKTITESDMVTGGDAAGPKGRIVASSGSYLEVLRSFKNLSPLRDAVLVNLDNSRYKQLVTCSGRDNTGSVNFIRMGTEFQAAATLAGTSDVVSVWALRPTYDDKRHSHLVVSTFEETFVYKMVSHEKFDHQAEGIVEGFVHNVPTLCVSNIQDTTAAGYNKLSELVVQVTRVGVFLLKHSPLGHFERKDEWTPSAGVDRGPVPEICAASINGSLLVLSLSDAQLLALNVKQDTLVRAHETKVALARTAVPGSDVKSHGPELYPASWPNRVSCVTCIPFDGRDTSYSPYAAAAFWHTNQVKIYKIEKFEFVWETPVLKAPVTSLLLFNFGAKKTRDDAFVLAGLANGTLACVQWQGPGKRVRAQDPQTTTSRAPRIIGVGNGPVTLSVVRLADGTDAVLAVADKAVMVSYTNRRMRVSSLAVQDIVAACELNTDKYSNSVVLAKQDGLTIGSVKELTSMHVHSIDMGCSVPERIVHDDCSKTFGVVCRLTRPDRVGGIDSYHYSFRLLSDSVPDKVLAQWNANANSEIIGPIATVKVPETDTTIFVVGTYMEDEGSIEVQEGHIRLFMVERTFVPKMSSEGYQLALLTSVSVDGCPSSLTVTPQGMLAVSVNSSVQLYRISVQKNPERPPSYSLQKVSEYSHFYSVSAVASLGERLVAADAMQAVSLFEIERNVKLSLLAKDYTPISPLSIGLCDNGDILGVNDRYNLFSHSLDNTHLRPVLSMKGFYHLGDMVSKFVQGSMTPADASSPLEPSHLMLTTSGSIAIVSSVRADEFGERLADLQRAMVPIVKEAGGTSHAKYRAPRRTTSHGVDEAAVGFLDGDYLEHLGALLEDVPEDVDAIFADSVFARDELPMILEALQNVHM